ncbi:hypothetical protein P7C71_g4263, partial [Lecanoromycetidae sp. Uapishka_2]
MLITHLALLVARIFFICSSACSATPLFAINAIPRSIPATDLSLNDPSPNDLGDSPEPTCTPPSDAPTSFNNDLGTFSSECIATANYFFNMPIISQVAWHWKRHVPGQPPQPGYNFLPLVAAPTGCKIKLDVLDDPDAEDQFALKDIAVDFRRLFTKCVRPNPTALAAGFVPVGPRRVLKLSIEPTPMGASLVEGEGVWNGTGLMNVTSLM